MKSIDKFVLVLVASLALLLAGCGGGSSTTEPDPGPTPEDMAAERAQMQTTAIMNASTALNTALGALSGTEPTQDQIDDVNAAISGLNAALAAAADVHDAAKTGYRAQVTDAQGAVSRAETTLMAMQDAADKAKAAEMAATGKALYAALAGTTAGANDNALNNAPTPALASTGLTIDAAAGAGALPDATDPASVELKAGNSAGSLGGWTGTDYALTTGTGAAKLTNEARVYTNRSAPKSVSFAMAGYTVATAATADDLVGYLTLDETSTEQLGRIMGAAFTHSGIQTHTYDTVNAAAFTTRGTYDGAPGEYRCTGACSSTNDGSGSPSALGGVWHFKPDAGAMVSQPDTEYLYYGWWVSKDKDGGPTAASAFAGVVEPNAGDLDNGGDLTQLTGSASYSGHAAGKFAMSNPLDGTGNGGHFTADANLAATFGSGTTAGVTGTIDNFRLNDGSEDPGWSVSLARGGIGAAGAISAPTTDPTVWSINGNAAPASGTWSGTMYDEMPGDPPDGDGNNIPTTVTGTFYSEFSTIGRMVGAFGADKE